jgi:hypothetical protein
MEGASLHGDDLVGVYPNRGAVDAGFIAGSTWDAYVRLRETPSS